MSSSYIVEPQESGSKKDDTLIIVVNDDGTISVDQETLQNLIMNQSNANVSVVRLGQTEGDTGNGDITLTVDPPTFVPSEPNASATANTDSSGLVDPFMEMDPEQLERLETALQSEEAKQILGENVTAMFDMLSVEEQQNSAKHNIQLDHCYTSRMSPSDPKPSDPLPIANSPDIDDMQYIHSSLTPQSTPTTISVSSDTISTTASAGRGKTVNKTGKPVGRQRRDGRSNVSNLAGAPKSLSNAVPKNMMHVLQQGANKVMPATNEKANNEEDLFSSSSESSESEEPSDNDSDFGPRGPRRGGIRARGGRKGLTTRGGSMAATRRRGPNKQMNMEQVRRLDMEMAAAVNAMKSPEKEDKTDKFNTTLKPKKQSKAFGGKKKDETTPAHGTIATETSPTVAEKPLQTTNQVKANLINANMIKGDMILTKPGQMRNNQKVIFVQKQVMMKASELKNLNLKKQTVVSKGNLLNQLNTKITTMKDGKLLTLPGSKIIMQATQVAQTKTTPSQVSLVQEQVQAPQPVSQQLPQKTAVPPTPVKVKPLEIKKEKKKSESATDSVSKTDVDLGKLVEPKTPDGTKKHQKKDHRKSPAHLVDALGPALFSTPDIIRRVSSSSDSKIPDSPLTPSTPNALSGITNCTTIPTMIMSTTSVTSDSVTALATVATVNSVSVTDARMSDASSLNLQSELQSQLQMDGQSQIIDGHKADVKALLAEELQPSLDPASNTTPPEGITQPMEQQPIVPNHIVSDSNGIEGEEHLLATLEMEASKHEEELLAEALLLQEELGVDLADHAALVDHASTVTESLMSASTFVSPIATTVQDHTKIPNITSPTPSLNIALEQRKKGLKDEKEPIQIVRGGRIITLPPIEAPATRSKRLQTKSELPQKKTDINKRKEKFNRQLMLQQLQHKEEMDSDMDDDDDEDDNSDSEDDPDRLWCICKRPHNNRFMICCDVCEDWFHGKCVHVSKVMGQQMEEQGIEWVCPNCTKKKSDEGKVKISSPSVPGKQQEVLDSPIQHSIAQSQTLSPIAVSSIPVQAITSSSTLDSAQVTAPFARVTQCVVCKKEARNSSIYCSDACILTHAQEYLTKDKPVSVPQVKTVKTPVPDSSKTKPDARVIVFERKTGKVLTGTDAPTTSNLKTWLKENPTYEVVRPNNLNTLQISGKTVTAIQTQGVGKISKPAQQIAGKVLPQSKTIFTKSTNSKQTVLSPNNKKTVTASSAQLQQQSEKMSPLTKPIQSRQTPITVTSKNPFNATKQAIPKVIQQQQQQQQQQPKSQAVASPKQVSNKKQEVKASTSQQKIQIKSPIVRKPEPEPIRLNIRKTLTELLSSRIKETDDLKLTDEEINDLALNIELELYKFFKDTGAKYKAKYRSLVFNIKDTKNLTLFRKIADRSLAPDAVVRLSPDEMASQELAEWREKETKHQLEMIKKNELDLLAQAKAIVVKTHKGEQIIENDGGIDHVDPKTSVQDIVTALNSGDSTSSTIDDGKKDEKVRSKEDLKKFKNGDEKKRKDKDRERDKVKGRNREKNKRERSQSRNRRHRSREREHSKTRERSRDRKSIRNKDSRRDKNRDRDREREKEKDRERDKDRERERGRDRQKEKENYKKSRGSSSNRSRVGHREYKERDKNEDERKKETEKKEETVPPSIDKPIEDRLWRHIEEETSTNTFDGNESDVSDREPSSTVTIKTPDINEEPEREKEPEVEREITKGMLQQTVWRGFVNMVDVAKFFITAQEISGHARDLMEDLPDTVDVVGRISHETVWDYISKMKKTGSKEILVIRLTAANDEEKIPYITLYSYLNSRSRLGVVGNVSKNIKDFYIMPFSSQSLIPQVLLPLDGPGFEEHRPHLLLGIIVRNKRKRISTIPSVIPTKITKKEPDRSYTPPLLNVPKDKTSSTTPPLSPISHHKAIAIDSLKEKQPVTQTTLETLNKAHIGMSRGAIDSATISKIVPELSSKINLTSSPGKVPLDDDGDAPYSPGDMDDDVNDNLPKLTDAATNILSPTKNSSELQRKMDELNRQIEEQKQQIQNISSSFLGEATPTLPGLGLDPPGANDSEEAYSPSDSRSFTPPPPGISKFTQPILDKVSDITIPPNLQEILANVKRQENSKVDPYLPSKPSATFLTSVNSSIYQKNEKYSSSLYTKNSVSNKVNTEKSIFETQSSTPTKETKSTLRSLSDLDLIKKAEEELAAVAAASSIQVPLKPSPLTSASTVVPPVPHVPASSMLPPSSATSLAPHVKAFSSTKDPVDKNVVYPPNPVDPIKKSFISDQPKPPGLEDEDFPVFPSAPPNKDSMCKTKPTTKFVPKSGIVLSVKRKTNEDTGSPVPNKTPRTKSRWGQGPSE